MSMLLQEAKASWDFWYDWTKDKCTHGYTCRSRGQSWKCHHQIRIQEHHLLTGEVKMMMVFGVGSCFWCHYYTVSRVPCLVCWFCCSNLESSCVMTAPACCWCQSAVVSL